MKQKILILILLIPLGLLTKFYTGPGRQIVNNHLGGVIYVVFFIFLASLVFPQTRAIKITLIVFIVTCALELTQLIQTDFLNRLREYFVVHALIGSSFNLMDMPFYAVGGGIGWWGFFVVLWIAILGEIIEAIAGFLGASSAKASIWSSFGALGGGIAGAIIGTMAVPIVGSLIGALVGTFGGAYAVEYSRTRLTENAHKVAKGALIGRIVGSITKMVLAVIMIALITVLLLV